MSWTEELAWTVANANGKTAATQLLRMIIFSSLYSSVFSATSSSKWSDFDPPRLMISYIQIKRAAALMTQLLVYSGLEIVFFLD
ncbi:hypothetical protein K7X08_032665 [Anisodus acutangulus]|uniref:Uncharacterized protein n=1 Tax=Anisodus acutangulus TaxID=402998 RepID=A0A9Q1MV54_9SOLA|nr:hypothetical protein K7X08_032665 [Anisodus acutangulus]